MMPLWPFVAADHRCSVLVIGSFLNVVIYRVPREESLVRPGLALPALRHPGEDRHNVPCSAGWCCAAGARPVPSRSAPATHWSRPAPPPLFVGHHAALRAFAATAGLPLPGRDRRDAGDDRLRRPAAARLDRAAVLRRQRPAADARRRRHTATGGSPCAALLGHVRPLGASTSRSPWPTRAGMGFGDVKLAGLLGLYLGWLAWGAVAHRRRSARFMHRRSRRHRPRSLTAAAPPRSSAIPFGPCMIAAAVLALFVAVPITTWYGSLLHLHDPAPLRRSTSWPLAPRSASTSVRPRSGPSRRPRQGPPGHQQLRAGPAARGRHRRRRGEGRPRRDRRAAPAVDAASDFQTKNVILGVSHQQVIVRDVEIAEPAAEGAAQALPFLVRDVLPAAGRPGPAGLLPAGGPGQERRPSSGC